MIISATFGIGLFLGITAKVLVRKFNAPFSFVSYCGQVVIGNICNISRNTYYLLFLTRGVMHVITVNFFYVIAVRLNTVFKKVVLLDLLNFSSVVLLK